jgi:hypothetical protein
MQPSGRGVVRKRVDDLLSGPLGCWVFRDVDMHDATTNMRQHDHHEQDMSIGTVNKFIDAAVAR